MSRSYNHRKDTTEVVVKKSGLLGKIVALLLGLVIGITAGSVGLRAQFIISLRKCP